jgi:hypothetical protein
LAHCEGADQWSGVQLNRWHGRVGYLDDLARRQDEPDDRVLWVDHGNVDTNHSAALARRGGEIRYRVRDIIGRDEGSALALDQFH